MKAELRRLVFYQGAMLDTPPKHVFYAKKACAYNERRILEETGVEDSMLSVRTVAVEGREKVGYEPVCDGLVLFGPSVNTSGTVAARPTTEIVDRVANPLGLPMSGEPLQRDRAPEEREKGKWTDGEREQRSKTAAEQRRTTDLATKEEHRCVRRWEPERKCLGLSATLGAAQEAHTETASHASGEVWHIQVRPEPGQRDKGYWVEERRGSKSGRGEERHRGA
ncbi:hypothetical protein NDU88_006734 [Pleurodeles waltl]|uniref:Uncharacterized protein n=1 Tax=Pleurodeles waltl TaxID=8319 RepID=A0AAV7RNB9_PLEWA|nr:hypothetical protein NDU88_006734 [Pleurodeles waltl]